MASIERQTQIMEILEKNKIISTSQLQKEIYCSTSTLRRELVKLEEEKKIIRSHGEVRLASTNNIEYNYLVRKVEQQEDKKIMADIAATFVTNNMSIFLDSSTTVSSIIPYLIDYSNLTIITNGLEAALQLSRMKNVTLYFAGGYIKYNTSAALGDFTSDIIDNFNADIAFFSCRGLDNFGTYEASPEQAFIKKQMIINSKVKILLADATKFDNSHYFKLIPFQRIDTIITNKEPSEDFLTTVKEYTEILWPGE